MSNAEMLRDVADVVERDGLRPYGVGDPYPPGTPDMIQALRRAGWMAEVAIRLDEWAGFYEFGTCSSSVISRPGRLNSHLGLPSRRVVTERGRGNG